MPLFIFSFWEQIFEMQTAYFNAMMGARRKPVLVLIRGGRV